MKRSKLALNRREEEWRASERLLAQEEWVCGLNPIDIEGRLKPCNVSNWRRRIKHFDGIAKAIWEQHAAKTRHKRGNAAYHEKLNNSVRYLCPLQ